MKKFILVFILLMLVLTFAGVIYYSVLNQQRVPVQPQNEVSVENEIETVGSQFDLGPSIYEDYSKIQYDNALKSNRVIVLYFTANWCPICREQEPINSFVFSSLDKSGVVGLRVHILDSETTDETNALAKKFDVVYQHTYVILDDNGAVFYKYTGILEEEELKNQILQAVNKTMESETETIDESEVPEN